VIGLKGRFLNFWTSKLRHSKVYLLGLADMLQMAGLDIDKNAVQRIESGKRFVTDIELKIIAKVLGNIQG